MSDFDKNLNKQTNKLSGKLGSKVQKVITLYHPRTLREKGLLWASGLLLITYLFITTVLSFWWDIKPDMFDVDRNALETSQDTQSKMVTGYTTTATIIRVAETMLDKPGGYLSNDVTLPGVWMDNMPNWEFGVLVQVRDIVRSLRNDMTRSQSQSVEDKDLANAEPQFNFQNNSWILPATETEYRTAIEALNSFLERLSQSKHQDTQFFARADNLRDWLAIVEKRLGSLSQRLSASIGKTRINTDLAGDSVATRSTSTDDEVVVKTPWLEIDDVFNEARGTTWALIHFFKAIETDFSAVLTKKNAHPSVRQIIRELEASQEAVWSPMVLNGGGFGIVANYSLVMANYISRANAAVIDLRNLLEQG